MVGGKFAYLGTYILPHVSISSLLPSHPSPFPHPIPKTHK